MELYNKILIRNEKEAQSFIDNWEKNKVCSFLNIKDFEKYPALLSYYEDENDYSMNYSAHGYYSITYLDDFEEYSTIEQSVADIYNYIEKELDNPYYDDNAYLERIKGYENVLKFIKENKLLEKDEK